MSVHLRKETGKYVVKIYLGMVDGKKRYKTVSTKTDNLEKAKAIESTLIAAKKSVDSQKDIDNWSNVLSELSGIGKSQKCMNLSILMDEWIKSDAAMRLADSTFRARKKALKRFLGWIKSEIPAVTNVHEVTLDVAELYKEWIRPQASGRTVNNYINDMRGVWRGILHKSGAKNVWSDVQNVPVTNLGRNSFERRALTKDEFERVLETASLYGREWEGAILFGAYTGLRLGDVARLNQDCIRDGALITVPGKTAKHGVKVFVPLHDKLLDWLQLCDGFNFFPALSMKYGAGDMHRQLKLIFSVIEDEHYKISFHCLRHTFRTWISAAGATLEQSKRLCGHLTDEMSLRYNHESERLKEMIERI